MLRHLVTVYLTSYAGAFKTQILSPPLCKGLISETKVCVEKRALCPTIRLKAPCDINEDSMKYIIIQFYTDNLNFISNYFVYNLYLIDLLLCNINKITFLFLLSCQMWRLKATFEHLTVGLNS